MPTGIDSLDPMLDGGVPPGSAVLLLGEHGAGNIEFVQTSIMHLAIQKQSGAPGENLLLPDGVSYVTFTRMKEDILREMALSFNPGLYNRLEGEVVFHDLWDSTSMPASSLRAGMARGASSSAYRRSRIRRAGISWPRSPGCSMGAQKTA